MTDAQTFVLVLAFAAAACILLIGYRRLPRKLDATIATPRAPIRKSDIPLRDALYLVQRQLDGKPTSRRKSEMSERRWRNAMQLCRCAELWDATGWHIESYRDAYAELQKARRLHVALAQQGRYVMPYDG